MLASYASINRFHTLAADWLERNPEDDKFNYAVRKVSKRALTLLQDYESQREDLNIEHCATDKDGVILRDDKGGFRFTKDGLKALRKAVNALFQSEVEIEPHFHSTQMIGLLTAEEREAFTGFVLREEPEKVNAASGD